MSYREPAVILDELVVHVCKYCMRPMSQHGTKDDLNYRDCGAQRWYASVVEGEIVYNRQNNQLYTRLNGEIPQVLSPPSLAASGGITTVIAGVEVSVVPSRPAPTSIPGPGVLIKG